VQFEEVADWKSADYEQANEKESVTHVSNGKGKGFPYSIPNVGPRADPDKQAVSPQVTVSHSPGGRLPYFTFLQLPPQPQSITAI